MSACDMVDAIKRQDLTSEEATEVIIERIEKINPIINAYCTPTFDLARETAKKGLTWVGPRGKLEVPSGTKWFGGEPSPQRKEIRRVLRRIRLETG